MSRSVIVISGAGGAGKTALVQHLLMRDKTLWFPKSWNTRQPRWEGEDEYKFVSEQRFQTMLNAGGFLEVAQVNDYRVGAPQVEGVNEDRQLILILTVEGWLQIRHRFPHHLSIWLHASARDRERRMRYRGDKPDKIAKRLELGRRETDKAYRAGYSIMVENRDGQLQNAIRTVEAHMAAFRCETDIKLLANA